MENQELIKQVTAKAESWLSPAFDAETQAEVKRMRTRLNLLSASTRTSSLVRADCAALWALAATA